VQLAAARGAAREKALEELHRRGDDDRRVPVLGGAAELVDRVGAAPVLARVAQGGVPVEAGMVLEDVGLGPQRRAKDRGGLLDDRREWDHVDHPAHSVRLLFRVGNIGRGKRGASLGIGD